MTAARVTSQLQRRLRRTLSDLRYWMRILVSRRVGGREPGISYGHRRMPGTTEVTRGGMVKFQRLAEDFPHRPYGFDVLYLGSSSLPRDWWELARLARWKGALLLYNQNGVAYPGWHGPGWEATNRPQAWLHARADHVFYQSRFCETSARRYLGPRAGSAEILYNAVDTRFFEPCARTLDREGLTLLLGGNQYQWYRFEAAARTLAVLRARGQQARLLITGSLSWRPDTEAARREGVELLNSLGVGEAVEFVGPFAQAEAPALYRRADVLLHTKYNDPCPSVVVEAMACGLPVVYSASGGVPELVGREAGVGVPTELDWERDIPPDPGQLAAAIERVASDRGRYSEAARRRAVDRFDLRRWKAVHRSVIGRLTAARARS